MTQILIADDDKHICELVAIHLSQAGFQVHQAKDGIEALEILKKIPCDLAVVDVMMPFMDGYTITKEIRKKHDIPIILLTAKVKLKIKKRAPNLVPMII